MPRIGAQMEIDGGEQAFAVKARIGAQAMRRASIQSLLHKDASNHASTTTAIETLKTISLEAGAMNFDGAGLRLLLAGTTAANANAKLITVVFGASEVWNSASLNANAKPWSVIIDFHRVGATETWVHAYGGRHNAAIVVDQFNIITDDLANAQNLAVKATDGIAGGTILKLAVLEGLSM